MRQLTALCGAIALAALGGCASLSESQCIASDWQTVGYADGKNGTSQSQLLKHQNACMKHGVIPDRDAYLAGWNEGVAQYCTPQNGFAAGERGAAYSNVCPEHMHDAFYAAYQNGRQLHLAQAEINSLQRAIAQKEHRLNHVAEEIADTEALLIEADLTSLERRALLDDTKALAQEQGALQTEIQDLKVDVALKAERLELLRRDLAYSNF